jgi:hypothetical protein
MTNETDTDNEHEHEPNSGATYEQRLWAGICGALSAVCLAGIIYLDRVHGSSQWQNGFIAGFACYFFAAMIIGAQANLFVEPDADEKHEGGHDEEHHDDHNDKSGPAE